MISQEQIKKAFNHSNPNYALNVLFDYKAEQYDRTLVEDVRKVDNEGYVILSTTGDQFSKSHDYATRLIKELRKYNMRCVDTRLNYTDLCKVYNMIFEGVQE